MPANACCEPRWRVGGAAKEVECGAASENQKQERRVGSALLVTSYLSHSVSAHSPALFIPVRRSSSFRCSLAAECGGRKGLVKIFLFFVCNMQLKIRGRVQMRHSLLAKQFTIFAGFTVLVALF